MTPWPTPSSPSRPSRPGARGALALAALVALLATACVTRGTHREVVAERDRLAEDLRVERARAAQLEASSRSLAEERVELLDQVETLRQRRVDLEKELVDTSAELAEAERSLASSRDALAAQRAAHADAVAAAQAELAALRETYDALVADLESEVEARGAELARYDALVSDLKGEVEAGQVEIARLREGGTSFTLPGEVVFAPGQVEPTSAGRQLLARLARRLRDEPETIEVHGHTDAIPTSGAVADRYPTNWELAAARATRVARLLVDAGISPDRVVAVSHGPWDPVAPNDTPEGRRRNRRIEIRLTRPPAPLPPPPAGP